MLVNESIMDTGESIPDVIRIQFHRIQYFSIWSPGFLLSSPGFSNASPSRSPGFSRVRVFFGSESESGPGFEVCLRIYTYYKTFYVLIASAGKLICY